MQDEWYLASLGWRIDVMDLRFRPMEPRFPVKDSFKGDVDIGIYIYRYRCRHGYTCIYIYIR